MAKRPCWPKDVFETSGGKDIFDRMVKFATRLYTRGALSTSQLRQVVRENLGLSAEQAHAVAAAASVAARKGGMETVPDQFVRFVEAANEIAKFREKTTDTIRALRGKLQRESRAKSAIEGHTPEQAADLERIARSMGERAGDKDFPDLAQILDTDFRNDIMRIAERYAAETGKHDSKLRVLEMIRKVSNAEARGNPITKGDIDLLRRIYGREFAEAFNKVGNPAWALKNEWGSLINIPKALMATGEMSYLGRQGLIAGIHDYRSWQKAWQVHIALIDGLLGQGKTLGARAKSLKGQVAFDVDRGEEVARQLLDDLIARADAEDFLQHGGRISRPFGEGADLVAREEAAAFTNIFERMVKSGNPIGRMFGGPGRRAELLFTTFINQQRVEGYSMWVKSMEEAGVVLSKTEKRAGAHWVNLATGHASLGRFEENYAMLSILNATFFSPRFALSRIMYVPTGVVQALNPVLSKPVRIRFATDVVKGAIVPFMSFAMIGKLGKALGLDIDVEIDPRSSQFGATKVGNTYVKMLGGVEVPFRYFVQAMAGKKRPDGSIVMLVSGKDAAEYNTLSRADHAITFFRGKLAPLPGLAWSYMDGRSVIGEEFSGARMTAGIFTPLTYQDIFEAYKDDEATFQSTAASVLAFGGASVATIEERTKKRRGKSELRSR